MPGPIAGAFFYLYLIVDVFSRKIVGWEVHDRETADFAAALLRRAVWSEQCLSHPLVLHADNGGPMKGATMTVTMERLGVIASFSRPRVSNGNPLFRGAVPDLQACARLADPRLRLDRGGTRLGAGLCGLV